MPSSVVSIIALVVLAFVPGVAHGAEVPSGLLGEHHCSVTFAAGDDVQNAPVWNSPARGTIVLDADYSEEGGLVASTYEFAEGYYADRPSGSGRWAWDGERVTFLDGPLVAPDEGWSLDALYYAGLRRMPYDTERGRTSALVVRSLSAQRPGSAVAPAQAGHEGEDEFRTTYWYCGEYGVVVAEALSDSIPYVRQTARIPVRLPLWFPTPGQGQALQSSRVVVARRGYYRIGLVPKSCTSRECSASAIFSAKRAPRSDLGHRQRVRLRPGVVGWVGDYGCAFNGTDPDWGPRYCGRRAIVWHQDGVNYCIEGVSLEFADLVAAARQAARAQPA